MWYSLALNFFGESNFRILLRSFTICVSSLCLSLRLLGGDDWIKGDNVCDRVMGPPTARVSTTTDAGDSESDSGSRADLALLDVLILFFSCARYLTREAATDVTFWSATCASKILTSSAACRCLARRGSSDFFFFDLTPNALLFRNSSIRSIGGDVGLNTPPPGSSSSTGGTLHAIRRKLGRTSIIGDPRIVAECAAVMA
jgi:hypothetical protein